MVEKLTCSDFFISTKQTVAVEPRIPQCAYPEHTHDFNEIVIVTHGQGMHILNGKPYELHERMIFYIQTADHHLYENVNDLCLTNILFRSPCQFNFLSNINELLPDRQIETETHWFLNKETYENVHMLLSGFNTHDDHHEQHVNNESVFFQLLIKLQQGRYIKQSNGSKEYCFQQLLRWLNIHFAEEIDWKRLADQFNLSLRTLYRYVKNSTNHTPQRYLTKLRLAEAYYQICYTDKNITTIAYDCGFNDSSYFSTSFKNEFNITPSTLRDCPDRRNNS